MKGAAKYKVGILSLGCPRNLTDSENILGRLCGKGHTIVDLDKADIGIVNTCAFIEEAKRESIDAILDLIELKKEGRLKKVIVYGCLTQRYKEELKHQLPEVDAFVGRVSLNHTQRPFSLTPRHYAYLKICEGCVNNCSYCIIPRIKGKFVSLDINTLLERAKQLDRDKVSELNIIGQDITAYGLDIYKEKSLPKLLNSLIKQIKNIGWLRLFYLYPSRIDSELLKIVRDERRICKYIDLPVQHINSRILKLMRRGTTKKDIFRILDKVRKEIPQVAIRTSVIVGFPSETDREFKELIEFIEEGRFERLGAFIYSAEEGSAAYNFKKQVPQKVKAERFNAVMARQQEISRRINQGFLGKTMDILIDEKQAGLYLGRSQYDAPEVDGLVYVKSKFNLKPGEFVKVKITDTREYDLVGEA